MSENHNGSDSASANLRYAYGWGISSTGKNKFGDAKKVKVVVPPVCRAKTKNVITFDLEQAGNGWLAVELTGGKLVGWIKRESDDVIAIEFTPYKECHLFFNAKFNDIQITKTRHKIVVHKELPPAGFTVSFPLFASPTSTLNEFKIKGPPIENRTIKHVFSDENEIILQRPPEEGQLTIKLEGELVRSLGFENLNDEEIAITYSVLKEGTYPLHLMFNDSSIVESPLTIDVEDNATALINVGESQQNQDIRSYLNQLMVFSKKTSKEIKKSKKEKKSSKRCSGTSVVSGA